ncbi:hypothetical protein K450DRAFT_199406 [Umbelopsis ramanniana AG]|uniref:Uncharacterized protein n=1 Tax=Umbelopsis ramanniana AG TaxID=1314678 RepID=A0AAD5E9L4_UMBRA|nr:uncharacterized protein K450DRAFT_199406 [Umbelopsis ramanniana AG]KAI8579382.1 hypothetical protein K450DRAFT_199406 [Umbelopsis ramanniana AG]
MIDIENFNDTIKEVYKTLGPFFKAYPAAYTSKDDNIYLDIKINALSHMNAFIQLAHISETQGFKIPGCFPLRKSNIPCHMTLDNRILRMKEDLYYWKKFAIWNAVFSAAKLTVPSTGLRQRMECISIAKQSKKPERHGYVRKKNPNKGKQEEFTYIEDLPQDQILDTQDQCVAIDPGRRDLLFCLQENSTSTTQVKLR